LGARRRSIFDSLLSEILDAEQDRPVSGPIRPEQTAAEIKALTKLDYAEGLRRCLNHQEVAEIVSIARKQVWPRLNDQAMELLSPAEFARRWSPLGVDFKTADWTWPEGLALLGVYLRKTRGVLKRPVICINTAHHPLMVGVSFDHEMGHHLTAQIFDSKDDAQFLQYTGYAAHLSDPAELAADVMVTLAGYPQRQARRLFASAGKEPGARKGQATASALEQAVAYIAKRYGLDFSAEFATEKKLQCLAALIHYTRLRQALLDEYDI